MASLFSKLHIEECVELPDIQEVFDPARCKSSLDVIYFSVEGFRKYERDYQLGELCKVPEEIHLEMLLIRLCHQNA